MRERGRRGEEGGWEREEEGKGRTTVKKNIKKPPLAPEPTVSFYIYQK